MLLPVNLFFFFFFFFSSFFFFFCMKGMFIYVYKQKAESVKQVYKQNQNDEINNINKLNARLSFIYTTHKTLSYENKTLTHYTHDPNTKAGNHLQIKENYKTGL
ncbi:hypothetical protein ACB098_05G068600 [Castanea mollissima]